MLCFLAGFDGETNEGTLSLSSVGPYPYLFAFPKYTSFIHDL